MVKPEPAVVVKREPKPEPVVVQETLLDALLRKSLSEAKPANTHVRAGKRAVFYDVSESHILIYTLYVTRQRPCERLL